MGFRSKKEADGWEKLNGLSEGLGYSLYSSDVEVTFDRERLRTCVNCMLYPLARQKKY